MKGCRGTWACQGSARRQACDEAQREALDGARAVQMGERGASSFVKCLTCRHLESGLGPSCETKGSPWTNRRQLDTWMSPRISPGFLKMGRGSQVVRELALAIVREAVEPVHESTSVTKLRVCRWHPTTPQM